MKESDVARISIEALRLRTFSLIKYGFKVDALVVAHLAKAANEFSSPPSSQFVTNKC